jgi:hypothetical protein
VDITFVGGAADDANEKGDDLPSSSTAKLVPAKYRKKSRGSLSATRRPPHQSSATATTGPWSDSLSCLIFTITQSTG